MAEEIVLKNYEKLLSQVKNEVTKTQSSIAKIATRKKVEMAWNIGRSISEHLEENNQSEKNSYGKYLFTSLENDVGIEHTVLYRMRSFYQTYPKLPRDDDKLNWSHYRILSGIKNSDDRKYLEELTRQKDLDVATLQKKAQKILKQKPVAKTLQKKLQAKRGKLFCYAVIDRPELGKSCIDCGFNIFRNFEDEEKNLGKIVESVKKNKNYTFQKTSLELRKINVYQAQLVRVVDGDTLHVTLDLGFGIFHEETLRLRGINAAEAGTTAGEKSTRGLKRILKNIPFFIIKTTALDHHGRYVADIFLADEEKKLSPQGVAENGVYLNQLLLDKKLVTLV